MSDEETGTPTADGSSGSRSRNDPAIIPHIKGEQQQSQAEMPKPADQQEVNHKTINALNGILENLTKMEQRMETSECTQREIIKDLWSVKRDHYQGRLEDRKWVQENLLQARQEDWKSMQEMIRKRTEPIRLRIEVIEREIASLKNGGLRARDVEPKLQPVPSRAFKKYTQDEDERMVRFLIETDTIRDVKTLGVWEKARVYDPVLARRTANALKQHFQKNIWSNVMRRQYDLDPQILAQFREIWPLRRLTAP